MFKSEESHSTMKMSDLFF